MEGLFFIEQFEEPGTKYMNVLFSSLQRHEKRTLTPHAYNTQRNSQHTFTHTHQILCTYCSIVNFLSHKSTYTSILLEVKLNCSTSTSHRMLEIMFSSWNNFWMEWVIANTKLLNCHVEKYFEQHLKQFIKHFARSFGYCVKDVILYILTQQGMLDIEFCNYLLIR